MMGTMKGCPEEVALGWIKSLEATCWNRMERTRVLAKGLAKITIKT